MMVTVRLFPPFNTYIGKEYIPVELENDFVTIQDVFEKIEEDIPGFIKKVHAHHMLIVLDGKAAALDTLVGDRSIINLHYPLCGG